MLPLHDDIPARRFPTITVGLIAINALLFLWELRLGGRAEQVLLQFALIPVRYTDAGIAAHFGWFEQLLPFLSSMFLHGGWLHLLGNLWILWIFGDNVEDRLGPGRYLLLYLSGGIAASVLHVVTNVNSHIPTLGASGAIAAVMGGYFRFFPQARVVTVIPPFIFGPYFVLPAVLFLGFWFLLQLLSGTLELGRVGQVGGVAWWAHVGGFVFGAVACQFARRIPPALTAEPAPGSR
ncbi:MAG: rhomboid family intramembrane serine protease [Verrucomicrobia bacterium]|nr:rhomboid family intramembrane serine protease [Verrucomicrobiota bacterium]